MKKTYIIPETTVVAINVRDNVMIGGSNGEGTRLFRNGGDASTSNITESDSRETVRSQDAWEEW